MENFFYICLFTYWLLFGSFSSVIIHRLKSNETWIWWGRSHCPKCNNTLKYYDLIPIFSWLSTWWKCRYCKEKIPYIYPILELSTWFLFTLIWIFLIDTNLLFSGDYIEIIKLIFWLSIWFITIIYIFYDILFLEIHEWVMLTWITIAFLWLIWNTFWLDIIQTVLINNELNIKENLYSIPLSISILWILYTIMLKELDLVYDFLLLWLIIWSLILFKYIFNLELWNFSIINWVIWAVSIFIFFFLQIVLSWWKALWWWDLRIWIMIWLLLWISYSFTWMMITYIIWSIISILIIIYQKFIQKNKEVLNVVPFGPFLWIWFLITVLFQNYIINIIEIYF